MKHSRLGNPDHICGLRFHAYVNEDLNTYMNLCVRLQRPLLELRDILICRLDTLRRLRPDLELQSLTTRRDASDGFQAAFEMGDCPRRGHTPLRGGILRSNQQGYIGSRGGHAGLRVLVLFFACRVLARSAIEFAPAIVQDDLPYLGSCFSMECSLVNRKSLLCRRSCSALRRCRASGVHLTHVVCRRCVRSSMYHALRSGLQPPDRLDDVSFVGR